jgi:MFS transporter, DHA1 family, tetracycline resistance protein
MKKEKLIIMFTVFVDVIGFGIVIPILPYYVKSFGAGALETTLMFSAFSFFSFLSSPFLGALSDRVGRRPILILSILSTAIGWIVFASANSIAFLFLGRIIDGAAAGNFTTAQSYLIDISKNEQERTSNLGLIGATFGIGFMVGPIMGGVLSNISHAFPFWVAGGLALINSISAYFFLPETHHQREREKKINFNPLLPLYRAATDKKLRPYYITFLLFALSFVTYQSVFALYSSEVFGFTAFTTGVLFTCGGVIVTLNQTVLLKRVWQKYFSNGSLEIGGIILLGIGLALLALKSLTMFLVGLAFSSLAQSILRVVITCEVAGHSDKSSRGETIGILGAIMSAAMVAGPVISGAAFEMNLVYPYLIGAGYMLLAFLIAYPIRDRSRQPIPATQEIASPAEAEQHA